MPSVPMRRSTRVFGARVLRSGRKLWTEPHIGIKYTRRTKGVNEWIQLLDNSADACHRLRYVNESGAVKDTIVEPRIEEHASKGAIEVNNVDIIGGIIVYKRKRRRSELTNTGLSEDKRFGKKFMRNQWMKKRKVLEVQGSVNRFKNLGIVSYDSNYCITSFLNSVLSYMTRIGLGIRRLSAFVLSKPIYDAYYSNGVLLLQDSFAIRSPGVCIIYGSRSLIPLFVVDFSAIPSCFMYMHTSMYIRSVHFSCFLVAHSLVIDEKDDKMIDMLHDAIEPSAMDHSDLLPVQPAISPLWNLATRKLPHSAVALPKPVLRKMQLRNSRKIRKRRSSLRRKKRKQLSCFRAQKANGTLVSDLRTKHDTSQFTDPAASVIFVPGVQEVSSPVDRIYLPYVRPDSLITMNDDELNRALVKKSANYDMDSEDEEWLDKFNEELFIGRELPELITPERFELLIDGLEKSFHCNADDYSYEEAAYGFCVHIERKEVVEAVRKYWIKKRNQKRSALVRIFQLYQPRRTQIILKSILRRKRSFKRQIIQGERDKQTTFLQVMSPERDSWERRNYLHQVKEAKAAAYRSEVLAVLKRQRAQMLMKNADLATYKATIALRIADAAQVAESSGTVASFFLC